MRDILTNIFLCSLNIVEMRFFFQKIIEFCDHIVNNEKVRMNEIKLKIIRN